MIDSDQLADLIGWRGFAPPHALSAVKKSQQESDDTCSIRTLSSVSMKCIVRM